VAGRGRGEDRWVDGGHLVLYMGGCSVWSSYFSDQCNCASRRSTQSAVYFVSSVSFVYNVLYAP